MLRNPWHNPPGTPPDNSHPKFTNEVQHLVRVLPWDETINRSRLQNGAKLPSYTPPGARSGKSRQLWIARHQRSLGRVEYREVV